MLLRWIRWKCHNSWAQIDFSINYSCEILLPRIADLVLGRIVDGTFQGEAFNSILTIESDRLNYRSKESGIIPGTNEHVTLRNEKYLNFLLFSENFLIQKISMQ